MAYIQSQYETQVQEYLQDTGTTNNNRMVEDLTVQVVGGNGSRTVFTLSRNNVLSTSAMPQVDVNQGGFSHGWVSSVDTANGILTTSSAPPLSSSVPTYCQVLYYFQHFTLAEIDEFVNFGLGQLSKGPMTGQNANSDFAQANYGEFNVVCLFAAVQGYLSLSNRYAQMVNVSGEGKSLGKGSISERYFNLAKEYYDAAEKERLAIYGPRQGRATVPQSIKTGQGSVLNPGGLNALTRYGGNR